MKKIPILLTIFNREDTATEAIKSIRDYKPDRLYIAADGPRRGKEEESQRCEQTRKAVLDAIDWHCDVKTLFREDNLGCAKAMYSAISWFFEQEECGIICEDDIVLSQDFYRMCEELLPKYKDDDRIMQITSQYYGPHNETADTYSFERTPFIWGWATWRRAWVKYMDMEMTAWPKFRIRKMLSTYGWFQTLMVWHYWHKAYSNLSFCTSWATRWHFAAVVNELLCLAPHTNLGLNVGCNSGTHYSDDAPDPHKHLKIGKLIFPLQHPDIIQLDKHQLDIDNAEFLRLRKLGAKKKIKKFLKKLLPQG